ncbi:hypothetical protein L3X38_025103 [Prunus dulcis]|uniref:Uncharacterized protein n=1 Tax=Prunus dulcis TaxID=3755 RepID=A0AAD4W143_PRUDU|nr:hypothetical protein L3X38_025103 [Prunus dulcis]
MGLLDDFVHSFDLAIGLRVGWGGETKTYLEVGAKLFKFGIVELPTIVYDNGMGDAKATYDILPDECLDASYCAVTFFLGQTPEVRETEAAFV